MTRSRSQRSTDTDFAQAGLRLLRSEGIDAVTIDRVCAALGKTKGSFYHHFEDLDAFNAALLDAWEQALTEVPIARSEQQPNARRRAEVLDALVSRLDHRLDRAVRAWAERDERARRAVARVDERRIDYLAQLHRGAGHEPARILAELEYAAFVGVQHIDLFADAAHAKKLARALARALAMLGDDGAARKRRTGETR